MNLILSKDFKTISLISNSGTANSDHPLLEIFVNGQLTFTLVVGGSITISGTVYETTANADNLNFISTTTTVGTQYIHTISSDTLGLGADEILNSGVWAFKFYNSSGVTQHHIGVVVHDDIDKCIMEKLNDLCERNCDINKIIEGGNKLYAILYSAQISAKKAQFQNAQCKYEIAKTLCKDCNV